MITSPAPAPLPDKFASLRGQTLIGELPDVLAVLADGPTDSGTPTEQPRAFLLDRDKTVRLVKAAISVVQVFDIELTGLQREVMQDLRADLDGINIDL